MQTEFRIPATIPNFFQNLLLMPRKPTTNSTPTTPTKAEKRRGVGGGSGSGSGSGGGITPKTPPHHARATVASAARSGSPSPRANMRIASSSSTSTSPSGGSGGAGRSAGGSSSSSGSGPGPAVMITAPPRAALSRTSSPAPAPAPDAYRAARVASGTDTATATAPGPGPDTPSTGSGSISTIITPPTSTSTPTVAEYQTLLKEKDSRIAHLERELLIMESEFTRELDKLSQSEIETSSFWQAKYSTLNQHFLNTDTELRVLRAEFEKQQQQQQQQHDSSTATSEQQEREKEKEKEQEQQQQQQRERERDEISSLFRTRYEALARELQTRDDEIRDLRAQIRGLKEWVSTSTRSDGTAQTSDEVFGEGMARLGNSLQNWVLVNFRRAKIDPSKTDEPTLQELGRLVPMYEDLASTSKINLIQSLVSRLLVEYVFDAYFVGLSSEQTGQFTQMETFLSSFASSPEAINQWRSMTLGILKKEADQKMKNETTAITESLILKANTLLDAVTDTKSSETRDQALRVLVGSSIELSRLLVVQRAIFKVSMPEILPHQRIMFDSSTMEDIGGEDEESLEEREICCVTFPGIIKRGDESGGHLQYRNVISKARVLCSPE